MPVPEELSASQKQELLSGYLAMGIPVDSLPYTAEFASLSHRVHATERACFRHLLYLRKTGKLPRVPSRKSSRLRVKMDPASRQFLSEEVTDAVGSLGSRDKLPFTDKFEDIWEQYRNLFGEDISRSVLWLAIANLSKRGELKSTSPTRSRVSRYRQRIRSAARRNEVELSMRAETHLMKRLDEYVSPDAIRLTDVDAALDKILRLAIDHREHRGRPAGRVAMTDLAGVSIESVLHQESSDSDDS